MMNQTILMQVGLVAVVLVVLLVPNLYKNQAKLDEEQEKWVRSVLLAVLFAVISSPLMYKLVNSLTSLFGVRVCDLDGCPNPVGLVLHSVVFLLAARVILEADLKKQQQ